eukprot:TRINITY_DN60828_c0_g1_i1.p1 TRINITY_DN60828_c0_g1~~TRINITY_DN60828_c0_g1_i1.p1  ORF type:complete len:834 (+),score=172.81 TRINITY_DN60828_c0_g1_i1:216-2504(+)
MLLHRTWAVQIEEALQRRASLLPGSGNTSALLSRQTQVRNTLRRLFNSSKPMAAPRTRLVRRFQDEDRGVDVYMLLFESWEGQAVPAVIFTPQGISTKQRLPAVLHLPGHLAGALRDPEEQKISLGLAQRGYVVMSFDPLSQGERQQYGDEGEDIECRARSQDEDPDSDPSKTPSCSAAGPACSFAHNHFGKQLWLLGRGAEELFVRDAQIALDVLQDLPWVDPDRIGAVGCSGGGMLTAYLGAVDPRVEAAAVACYFSTLGRELESGTCNYDAEQILWNMAKFGIDKPDMLVARAPKPTAVLLTSHDCFPFVGGREGFSEIENVFYAHGDPSALYASEAPGFHEVTKIGLEAVMSFFDQQLKPTWRPRSPPEVTPFPCSRLWFGKRELEIGVSPETGWHESLVPQLLRTLARPLLQRLRARRRIAEASAVLPRSRGSSFGSWMAGLPQVSKSLAQIPLDAVEEVSSAAAGAPSARGELGFQLVAARKQYFDFGSEEWFILYTGGACAVTLRLFRTEKKYEREAGLVTLIFGGGSELNRGLEDAEDVLLTSLRQKGLGTVVVAGLCGLGDKLWRGGFWQFAPFLLGKTHTGFHAAEVLWTVSWTFRQLRARKIIIIAAGAVAGAALHASLHVPHATSSQAGLSALVMMRSVSRFEEVVLARRHRLPWQMQMHGVLHHYDLPDLLAAIPRAGNRGPSALVLSPLGPRGERLGHRRALAAYRLARRCFRVAGSRLRVLAGKPRTSRQEARLVAAWLASQVFGHG